MEKSRNLKDNILDFISYLIITFIMGLSFFLLFINIYHCNEVNYVYEKDDEEIFIADELKKEVSVISLKLAAINLENYTENANYSLLVDTNDRINKCVSILNSENLYNSLDKEKMNILDIYEFQENYQNNVVDECLVKQLYGIVDLGDESDIMNNFIKNNIDIILTDVSYVKNNLLNNSSYYFSTNASKNNVFNLYKESYYQIVSSYRKTVNFVDMVAEWYIKSLGGNNE